jgi:hypothetical protein
MYKDPIAQRVKGAEEMQEDVIAMKRKQSQSIKQQLAWTDARCGAGRIEVRGGRRATRRKDCISSREPPGREHRICFRALGCYLEQALVS